MSSRARQRQVWADEVFKDRLEKLHAKALLKGKKFNNLGDLTKEIVSVPAFDEVERQILEGDDLKRLGVKFDHRL